MLVDIRVYSKLTSRAALPSLSWTVYLGWLL